MSRSSLVLRVVLVGLVALAVADPRPWGGSRPAPAVLLVDVSASMGPASATPRSAAEDGEAWLASADGVKWVPAGAPPPALARAASTLGLALTEVAVRHPGRDVVLVSDGRATDDALAGARAVRAAGGRVWARLPLRPAADVGLLEARARRAGTTEVLVRVAGSAAGRARVELSRGSRVVAQEDVDLAPGAARGVRLVDAAPPADAVAYAVRLRPLAGTPNDDPGNDELALGVRAETTRVLVWGDLSTTLWPRSQDDDPRFDLTPTLAPGLADTADLVVLVGLPWWRIGPDGAATLARFVAGGGRLLVLGGPEGYGPGGWGGTPLERALLPFTVRAPPGPGADWALALDVSGSTRGERLAALKSAARATLDALQPGERLAVLPFRGRAAAPLAPGFVRAGDDAGARALLAALESLEAGGATDLVGGVDAALALLAARAGTHERRLVLLTDGDPDDEPDLAGWRALRPRLDAARVKFGAVVVDMPRLVEVLRAHVVANPESVALLAGAEQLVPRVLRELARQRADSERGRLGSPSALDASAGTWAALLPGGWRPAWIHDLEPQAEARVLARARAARAPEDASLGAVPFAAERTVGAGRVAALAWGPERGADVEAFARFLVPMARRLAAEGDRGLAADLDAEGRLEVRVPAATGAGSLSLVGASRVLPLLEVAPGLFRSEDAVPDEEGLRVRGAAGAAATLERVVRLPVRPPPEHRGVGPDRARLTELALAGGGRVLAPGEPVPAGAPKPGPTFAPWLLLAACILLVVDRARTPLRGTRAPLPGAAPSR